MGSERIRTMLEEIGRLSKKAADELGGETSDRKVWTTRKEAQDWWDAYYRGAAWKSIVEEDDQIVIYALWESWDRYLYLYRYTKSGGAEILWERNLGMI